MDSEPLPPEPNFMKLILHSGPLGMTSAAFVVISAALFLIWLSLVVRRRRAFPFLAFGIVFAVGGFWLGHYLFTLRSYNLTSVHLLAGYELVHHSSTDSYVGSIARPGGLQISIDIGPMSGLWADPAKPEKHIWVFQQTIRGHTVFIGLRPFGDDNSERLLCVTFPQGAVNFFAVVHSDRDIAEILSMALTYEPNG